ncbi:CRISPR-associated protein Cas4 [Candidatus Bathyarchaeota archaeon]|nr:CRISPR-associated protein Cas4 [Candidatus Bathyarchaeota archaeon]
MEHSSSETSITISDVVEYLFCPRFIYFIHCQNIPQREGRLFKVLKGRQIHSQRFKTNLEYLRKKLGVERKERKVYMYSPKLRLRGEVDEVLFLKDGTAAPFDYKYAKSRNFLFRTHRIQLVLYSMLIEEKYNIPVTKAYLSYTRSGKSYKEFKVDEKARQKAKAIVEEIFSIIQKGYSPQPTRNRARCLDCCYRRICAYAS